MTTNYASCDDHGWLLLLAAIARRWWLDGLERPRLLYELAEWLEVDVEVLRDTRPVKFYAEREPLAFEDGAW